MKYIFGPVPSRRLGLSLGIDLVPYKVCSFDCVYCECGFTTLKTTKRDQYVPVSEVKKEFEEVMRTGVVFDYATFSGYGEPLLNSGFFEVASFVKGFDVRLALLTNSSLFIEKTVRAEAAICDVILPSLDAATEKVFQKINRPAPGISVKEIIKALAAFRKENPGVFVALEILFVKGFNDTESEIAELKKAVEYIEPDEVHLNTVVRPPAEDVEPVSDAFLKEVASFFGPRAKVVGGFSSSAVLDTELLELIENAVKRRPMTAEDIASLLGRDVRLVEKYLERLVEEKRVSEIKFKGKTFFRAEGK